MEGVSVELDLREGQPMIVPFRLRGSMNAIPRGLLVVILCLAGWGMVVLAGPGSHSRFGDEQQKKKAVEEEEDGPKPKKRVEEEEDDKPKKRKVVRVEDEDDKTARAAVESTDLGKAASAAVHPKVKALFAGLALPYDEVKLHVFTRVMIAGRQIGGKVTVEPMSEYIPDLQNAEGILLTLKIINRTGPDAGKVLKKETVAARKIDWIHYYEQLAIEQVKEFREIQFTRYPQNNVLYLTRYDQLLAAEQALSAVVRFHQSARERGVRKGDAWKTVADELRRRAAGRAAGGAARAVGGEVMGPGVRPDAAHGGDLRRQGPRPHCRPAERFAEEGAEGLVVLGESHAGGPGALAATGRPVPRQPGD